MTAHVLVERIDPRRPATLSKRVLSLLRQEIGYQGLVFSDDLEMRAVADRFTPDELVTGALGAGVDALLVCSRADLRAQVLDALEAAPDALVERSLARMAEFKRGFAGGRRARGGSPPYAAHLELASRLT